MKSGGPAGFHLIQEGRQPVRVAVASVAIVIMLRVEAVPPNNPAHFRRVV
jgi:hypothetical protein